jgi:hypothetical protein
MRKLAFTILLAAAALAGADISGTWRFEVQTDAGTGSPEFVLKQEGEKLSGTYKGMLGEAQVRGTVKGSDVVIEFDTDYTGEKMAVRYTGKLDSPDKMTGKVALGEYTGTFTGTRKEGK